MKRIYFNEFEKVVLEDFNDVQDVIHQSIYEKTFYELFQRQGGFIGNAFLIERTSSTVLKVNKGRGFLYDSSQTGYSSKFQALHGSADSSLTLGSGTWAADPGGGLNRKDIVCVKALEVVDSTESRYVKTAGVGPIVSQTVDKVKEYTFDIQVVEGTPTAGTPSAPATPAGWTKIATVVITGGSGVASSSDITDNRVSIPYIGGMYLQEDVTPTTPASGFQIGYFANGAPYFKGSDLQPTILGRKVTKMTIANNTTAAVVDAASSVAMTFDKTKIQSAIVEWSAYRKTAAPTEVAEVGRFAVFYKAVADAWTLQPLDSTGDDSGVIFSINSTTGAVSYTTTNITGSSYVGTLRALVTRFDN